MPHLCESSGVEGLVDVELVDRLICKRVDLLLFASARAMRISLILPFHATRVVTLCHCQAGLEVFLVSVRLLVK